LAGLVVAIKDNIDVAGLPTTAACPEYAYVPETTAPAAQRLIDAGAVILGKTNMDQFATGLVGRRSPYGAVRSAWSAEHISGGSSSGSAVAVALGIVDAALGTDTAGSGRVPAAFNEIIGVKPTLGLVPIRGVVPASAEYDVVSVFAGDIDTAAIVLTTIVGPDADGVRSRSWPSDVRLAAPESLVLGVPRDEDLVALDPEFRDAFDRTVDAAHAAGLGTETVDISTVLKVARLLYGGALLAQRYDAVGAFLDTEPDGADPVVSEIIRGSRDRSTVEYAHELRRIAEGKAEVARWFDRFAGLLLPTSTDHPTIAEVAADPIERNKRLGTFTNFCNLLDLSAVAFPGSRTSEGEPFGVSVVVPAFHEQVALDIAARLGGGAPPPLVPDNALDVAVFGAHLRGQPLNHELRELGARYVEDVTTTDAYRRVALATDPPKPGLVRHGEGLGSPIRGELWRISPAGLGRLLASLPAPMSLTPVELADGRSVVGFGCAYDAARRGEDITHFGGWVAYRQSLAR